MKLSDPPTVGVYVNAPVAAFVIAAVPLLPFAVIVNVSGSASTSAAPRKPVNAVRSSSAIFDVTPESTRSVAGSIFTSVASKSLAVQSHTVVPATSSNRQ